MLVLRNVIVNIWHAGRRLALALCFTPSLLALSLSQKHKKYTRRQEIYIFKTYVTSHASSSRLTILVVSVCDV